MRKGADVVVLGGGVAGCAAAYFLARDGAAVTVVERDGVGSGASGYALGQLNPLTGDGIPGPVQPLADAAFRMHRELWPRLTEESKIDFQASMVPHMEVYFTAEDAADHREERERWSEAPGFRTEWLGPDDVSGLEPRIAGDVYGGLLLEDVGMLDSYLYTVALSRAAMSGGAAFVRGEVVGLQASGSRVSGVRLEDRRIDCDAVVVALGPWSGRCSQWLGTEVPIEPLKGEIVYLEGLDPPLRHHIHGPCSVVQKADGLVWVAATMESAGFDLESTESGRDLLLGQAFGMVPCLVEQRLVRQTACLRPLSADSLPILGRMPGWEGVYMTTGAGKKGILFSPATGRAVADLVLNGETALPIGPFDPGRLLKSGAAAADSPS